MGQVKTLEEIKTMIRARTGKRNVFRRAKQADVESVLERLAEKDPERWAAEWSRVAADYENTGIERERRGQHREAMEAYLMAYTYYTIGRYPVPHTAGKKLCFEKSLELYEKAGYYFTPPLMRVEIPFSGQTAPAYLRIPHGNGKRPVVINFGGIDSFKAECFEYDEALLAAGFGTLAVDMPGVGESPIKASPTADRLFSAVIDYLEKRAEVDPERIAIVGRSFGGYWAAKMAHVEAQRLRAAVVWGGGVHYFFQEEWLRESTHADSYLLDHDIARCSVFGVKTLDELAEKFPAMSLKDQGWLDKPSCPMLIVNGKDDKQTPIEDLYILLEHGAPKSARIFPGGHMGQTPETLPTIVRWLKRKLMEMDESQTEQAV
ncbi:MAG TPA: alpha/beta fold hydrolase [Candidatus Binatia bacterium]|jgi:pimeloyl-ACP methyl ester carboxylesterase